MRLVAVKLKNFRGYRAEQKLRIEDLTALVGRNDVGKSTIFEALGIFFGHPSCKIDPSDRCVHAAPDEDVEIVCTFADVPAALVIDEAATTALADEYMLNVDGHLEIKKRFSGEKLREEPFVVALLPLLHRLRTSY